LFAVTQHTAGGEKRAKNGTFMRNNKHTDQILQNAEKCFILVLRTKRSCLVIACCG
jgi:hypothetical protein